jgi:hypothetical protein
MTSESIPAMEQFASASTAQPVPQPTSRVEQIESPPSLNPLERRRVSVLEYLIEPDVPEHDYASQPPPDEELPEYDSAVRLPLYTDRHLQRPVVSYCIYQIGRKLQCITPAALDHIDRPRYRLSARGSLNLISRKADFTLTRLPGGRQAALGNCSEKDVATMNFDRNGEIPWMPRALVWHGDGTSSKKRYRMHARDFESWTITMGSESFTWRLTERTISLIFVEHSSDSIVARFSYSKFGTDATRGAEVGRLDIYGGSRSEEQDTIELVIASCKVAVEHLKSMGRHYRNDATSQTRILTTPRTQSVATTAMEGSAYMSTLSGVPRRASYIV